MALQKLKDELPEIKMPQDQGPNPYQDFVRTLTEAIEDHRSFFLKTQLDKTEEHVNLDVIGSIFEEEKDVVANKMKKNFIDSPTLDNFYNTQFLALKNAIKRDVDEKKSDNGGPSVDDYKLPLERVCSRLPPRSYPKVVVKDVCPKLHECATSPHGSKANACTDINNKCTVKKALSMMLGFIIYKVYFLVVDKFSSERCPVGACDIEGEFKDIFKQIDLMNAFIGM